MAISSNNKKCTNIYKPYPQKSATLYVIGTIRTGRDGNKWIVKKTPTKQTWTKLKIT